MFVGRKTLAGLMGHNRIQGLNTEEAIVEAMNRQLNSNVRQVSNLLPQCDSPSILCVAAFFDVYGSGLKGQ